MIMTDDRQAVVTKIEAKKWYEFGCLDIFTNLLGEFTGITRPKVPKVVLKYIC